MSLQTETYADLVSLVQALIGGTFRDASPTDELTRVNALANRRAYMAYKESDWWPRYLVVGEPRSVTRGLIEGSQDGFYVFGAGLSIVNGLYVRDGSAGGKNAYAIFIRGERVFRMEWDGTKWVIITLVYVTSDGEVVTSDGNFVLAPGDVVYENTDTGSLPPETGWTVEEGDEPAPRVRKLRDVDTFLRFHRQDPYEIGGTREYYFDRQGNQAWVHGANGEDVLYATYKALFTDKYGTGQGQTTDVPREFFEFMAYGTAFDYMVSERKVETADTIMVWRAQAQDALMGELAKINSGINNFAAKRVRSPIKASNVLN